MAEEIDYRTLNEVQLKYELKKLEKRILRITGDPLATGKGYRKFFRWASNKNSVDRVREMMSDRSFILHLLFEKHCTPAEVARLERMGKIQRLIDRIMISQPGYALCPENRQDGVLMLNPVAEQVAPKRFHYTEYTKAIVLIETSDEQPLRISEFKPLQASLDRITGHCEHTCLLFGKNPDLGHDIHILIALNR